MKKQIQLALALFMIAFASRAQTPALFKYQSVVRDNTGAIIADQDVSFEINILTGSADGNSIYTEEHHVTTNAHGLANMTIGNGSITSGNSIADVDWGGQLYFLQISVDLGGGSDFEVIGTSQLLSVPYALHAKTVEVDNVEDADADSNNEIQDLVLSNNKLKITNNNDAVEIDLSNYLDNTDDQIANEIPITAINGLGSSDVQGALEEIQSGISLIDTNDADSDATNEIQDLVLEGSTLTISDNANATPIDLSPFQGSNTDEQTLDLQGNVLSITNGNNVDLSAIQDGFEANTDEQSLSLIGTNLSISGGNEVDLSSLQDGVEDADADASNEIQDLSLNGSTLSITNNANATDIDLSAFQGNNTDEQTLDLQGNVLSITNGNNVDLSTVQDGFEANTDEQSLSLTGTSLSISGGNEVDLSSLQDGVEDADADASNEIQDLSLNGSTLSITNNANATNIDLSPFQGNNTDEQTLDLQGNVLSITNGNNVDLSDLQDGFEANTDEQSLSLTGTNLSISGGNDVNLSSLQDGVDDADADASNEIQDLSLVGSTLKITNNATATEIDLSPFDVANTDEQDLNLTGNTLSLTNDATNVDLSGYLDNTDDQTLVFSGTDISISGGNSVDISSLKSLALPVQTVNTITTIDNTSKMVRITAQVELILPATPTAGQILHVLGGNGGSTINPNGKNFRDGSNFLGSVTLSFTDMVGGQGAVVIVYDGFNWNFISKSNSTSGGNQTLSLTGTNLSISDGNMIDLASLQDGTGTDNQTIDAFGLSGTMLSLSLEGDGEVNQTVDLTSLQDGVNDADADATNEIQDLSLVGSTLKITNNAAASEIDLSPFAGTNTDEQTLSLTGTSLSITNGNGVNLASLQDGFEANTDAQDLDLSGNTLSLTNDASTIDLSGYLDNTDNQGIDAFSLSGTTLSLSLDNDGEANQTVDLSSLSSSNLPVTTVVTPTTLDTRSQIVRILPAGIIVTLPAAPVTGQEIYIAPNSSDAAINANGKTIRDEAVTFSNTNTFDVMVDGLGTIGLLYDGSSWRVISKPNKKLSLSGNTLALTHDNIGIDLSNYLDNTDAQTIDAFSLSGTTLSLSLEGDGEANQTVDLSSLSGAAFTTTTNVTSNSEGAYASDDFVFGSPQLGNDDDSDHYSKFFFDKSKGAFRAGNVFDNKWDDAKVGLYSVAMGSDTEASANYAMAIGGSTASGQYSIAMGNSAEATSSNSVAMGLFAEASGESSVAIGRQNTASGSSSIALGFSTTASGLTSTAMGNTTVASGSTSTAMGNGTTSSGNYATSMGLSTTAQAYASLVIGRYNLVSGTTSSWVSTEPLFVLGNGSSAAARSNALTVLKNGNMGIGVEDPDVELEVSGKVKISDMLKLTPQASAPAGGTMGDIYMDTDGKLYLHNGVEWKALAFE